MFQGYLFFLEVSQRFYGNFCSFLVRMETPSVSAFKYLHFLSSHFYLNIIQLLGTETAEHRLVSKNIVCSVLNLTSFDSL